jgi:hypothetical protein
LLAIFAFLPALVGLVVAAKVVVPALALLIVVPFVVALFVDVLFIFVIDGGLGRSFDFDVFAERRYVQRIFVRGIGLGFCDSLWSAHNFLNSGFFIRLFRVLGFLAFFVFFFVVLFILFFVFKDGATPRGRVGIDFFTDQILLGVNDAVGENGGLFVADGGFGCDGNIAFRVDIGVRRLAHLFLFMGRSPGHSFGRISSRAGEQPAGQSAARTARRAGRGRLTGNTRLRFLGFGLRRETLRFDNGSGGFDRRFAAIFG